MRYPFCVLDIDGTLTHGFDIYHPQVIDRVRAYRERGGTVALLSGRLPHGMLEPARHLGLPPGTLIGGGDGAVLARLDGDGQIAWVWTRSLRTELLLPHLVAAGQPGLALTPARVVAVGATEKIMNRLASITAPQVSRLPDWTGLPDALGAEPLVGLRFILERADAVRLIAAFTPVPEGDQEVFDNQEFTHHHVGFSIRPAGCDKGTALVSMMAEAGFPPEHTAAFGDWITDIPMLRNAGRSAAPRDALQAVREAATRVSAHAIGDGWLAAEMDLLE
jgi:hydroxymethylpyrimidine pyrophosphatase-like HAD family hydrolase